LEVLYVYLPEHRSTVDLTLDVADTAMTAFGEWFGPYPYDRLTIVDVPDAAVYAGAMEYPTLVTAGPGFFLPGNLSLDGIRTREAVIVHEVGHQWWQSMVAFNEAEEPWLDEGITEYATNRVMSRKYGSDRSFIDIGRMEVGYLDGRRAPYIANPHVSMYGRAWDFDGRTYPIATYDKPLLGLTTLERMLGEEMMLTVLRTFFRRYQFGHPTTEDFRAVAEEVVGEDLSWFFDGLVYGDATLNYAVTALDGSSVTVAREGDLVIATEVLITFCDDSSIVEPWDGIEREVTWTYPGRAVCQAEIDPGRKLLVDLSWIDNGLARRPAMVPWMALVSRWIGALLSVLLSWGGL